MVEEKKFRIILACKFTPPPLHFKIIGFGFDLRLALGSGLFMVRVNDRVRVRIDHSIFCAVRFINTVEAYGRKSFQEFDLPD